MKPFTIQGQVQGVGFRYTTLLLARGYDVSGSVQNLADARVRVEVEGEQPEVNAFLAAIEERMGGFVRHVETCGRAARAPVQWVHHPMKKHGERHRTRSDWKGFRP